MEWPTGSTVRLTLFVLGIRRPYLREHSFKRCIFLPPSQSSRVHRQFHLFQDEEDFAEWSNEDAVDVDSDVDDASVNELDEPDIESARASFVSKRLSHSRDSAEHPLLSRMISSSSYGRDRRPGSRLNQKIYIASEDLTAVFAGFSTSRGGFALYLALCVLTGGFAYLLFRWLPRWRVKLIGKAAPLAKCDWIAIEVRILQLMCSIFPLVSYTSRRINGIISLCTKLAANHTNGSFLQSL
jgi:P-type ATPase transporter.